jgi:spermidine/putrescine transport system ATP-binding protein
VLILYNGEIIREGSPAEVWTDPGSVFAAGFLGSGNVFEGKVMDKEDGRWKVESGFGVFAVRCVHEHQKGDNIHLLARPLPAENEPNVVRGVVTDAIFQQDRFKVMLDNGLYVYLPQMPKLGEKISVPVKVECLA